MARGRIAAALAALGLMAGAPAEPPEPEAARWRRELDALIVRKQQRFKGDVAWYVIDPELEVRTGTGYDHPSYLASGIKLAFMVEVFRQAHEGRLSLDEELTYGPEDIRDGAPRLNPRPAGSRFSIRELLKFMIGVSDNAASDMLARRVGVHNIEHGLRALGFEGFTRITTLIDVRRGVFREVDVHADDLTPLQIRDLRWTVGWHAQAAKLTQVLGRPPGTYSKDLLLAAYDRYYATETNCARLDTVAAILERLWRRELISPEASEAMIALLSDVNTSRARLLGRLPPGTKVAHKTGSQYERICDLGIITLPDQHPLILTACLRGGNDRNLAEATLAEIARHAYDLAVAAHQAHAARASAGAR